MSLFNLLFRLRLLLAPPETRRNDLYGEIRKFLYQLNSQGASPAARLAGRQIRSLLFRLKMIPSPPPADYLRWIQEREPTPDQLAAQKSQAAALPYQPRITVIVPVFNPSPPVLRDTLNAIAGQTYPYWEGMLVDGGSTVPGVAEVLQEQAARDPRFQVLQLEENRGISENINAARSGCRGDFVAVVDHDDLVAPDLFFQIALKLNEQPGADILYFDEDKVSADGGTRHSPWFKPSAWSPDLLLSTNYLMHGVFRRSLLDELDWFDPSMSGAQDWDLALRATRRTQHLAHIPRVLYHWRQVPGSAAGDANAKPWAFAVQERCLGNHLQGIGAAGASIEFPSLGQVRIRWPEGTGRVSIIIPTRDKVNLLRPCLETLLSRTRYPDFEILLMDTGSTDSETHRYYETLKNHPKIRRIDVPGPFNFSRVNNLGAEKARGELLLFLNNDTEILDPDWLSEMAGWAGRPGVGIVGAKLLRPDGTLQHAGIIMGLLGHGSHVFDGGTDRRYTFFGSTEWYRDYLAVTGACLLMPRQVFEAVGGFDPAYAVGYGDIELCLRTHKRGYRVVYTPYARLIHREGGSRGFDLPPGDVLRASLQMYPVIHSGDPYFNPNLSYVNHQPSLPGPAPEIREDRILKILEDFNLVVQEKAEGEASADPFFSGLADSLTPENWPLFPKVLPAKTAAAEPPRPRLLLVTVDLSLSGAPLMLWLLARHLVALDSPFRLRVLASRPGPLEDLFDQAGIEVIVHRNVVQDSRWCAHYLSDRDLLVANTITSWRAVVAARAMGKPSLWWIHESKFGWRQAHFNPSIARTFPLAGKIVFPCEATRRLYASFSDGSHYVTVPNGLDWGPEPAGDNPRTDPAPNHPTFKLVVVGSIEPRKGQDILLRALRGLPREIQRRTECFLVGRALDSGFHEKLRKQSPGEVKVHWVGEVPRDQVRQLLRGGEVLVLPSRDEVFPTSLLEALAEGKGVIAAAVGGVPEIVAHGREGLLFKAEDHRALARHITRFYRDREFLRSCGVRGRRTFEEKFTFQRFAREMEQTLQTLAASGSTPVPRQAD